MRGGGVSGNGRRRGLIKGRGRHRDPNANTIWYPRMPVSSTGVPVYVTAAAGAVVAGMITTVAPSTTAETTRTDLVSASNPASQDAVLAAVGPTPEPTVTAWPEGSVAHANGHPGSDDRDLFVAAPAAPNRAGPRTYVLPTPAGVLRAGSAVRQMGRGVGSVFAIEGRAQWLTHSAAPLPGPRLPDDVAVGTVYVAMPAGAVHAMQSGRVPLPRIDPADMDQAVIVPPLRDPVAVVDTTGWVLPSPLAPMTAPSSTGSGVTAGGLVVVPATVMEVAPGPAVVPETMLPDPSEPDLSQMPPQQGLVVAQDSTPDAVELTTEALVPRSTPQGAPEAVIDYQPPVLGEFIPEQPEGPVQPDSLQLESPQPDSLQLGIAGWEGGPSTPPEHASTSDTADPEGAAAAPTEGPDSGAPQITPGEAQAAPSDGAEPQDIAFEVVAPNAAESGSSTPEVTALEFTEPEFTEPVWTSTEPWPTQTWQWEFQDGSSGPEVTESIPEATRGVVAEDSPGQPSTG